jgi:hypothetical protein
LCYLAVVVGKSYCSGVRWEAVDAFRTVDVVTTLP